MRLIKQPSTWRNTLKRKTPNNERKQPTPEEMGNMLISIYESGYLDQSKVYKMSFIKGVLAGFGGVLGASILVALLLWFLSFFSNIPFVGRIAKNVTQTVETSSKYQQPANN